MVYIYVYNGLLLSHKTEWNLAIRNNMNEPMGYSGKWSKLGKER